MNKINFTSCKRLLGKAYNGANGKKIAVEYKEKQYMLKFPPSGMQKPTERFLQSLHQRSIRENYVTCPKKGHRQNICLILKVSL